MTDSACFSGPLFMFDKDTAVRQVAANADEHAQNEAAGWPFTYAAHVTSNWDTGGHHPNGKCPLSLPFHSSAHPNSGARRVSGVHRAFGVGEGAGAPTPARTLVLVHLGCHGRSSVCEGEDAQMYEWRSSLSLSLS